MYIYTMNEDPTSFAIGDRLTGVSYAKIEKN